MYMFFDRGSIFPLNFFAGWRGSLTQSIRNANLVSEHYVFLYLGRHGIIHRGANGLLPKPNFGWGMDRLTWGASDNPGWTCGTPRYTCFVRLWNTFPADRRIDLILPSYLTGCSVFQLQSAGLVGWVWRFSLGLIFAALVCGLEIL